MYAFEAGCLLNHLLFTLLDLIKLRNVAENERLHKKLVIAPIFLLKLEMIHNESNVTKNNGIQAS